MAISRAVTNPAHETCVEGNFDEVICDFSYVKSFLNLNFNVALIEKVQLPFDC